MDICLPVNDYARWRPLFEQAIDQRFYTIEHLDRMIFDGITQIWFGEEAAIVTELKTYPTGVQVIEGIVAAGDLDEIVEHLIPKAEAWAKEFGCKFARIESREGWAKVLKKKGWEVSQTALVKEL